MNTAYKEYEDKCKRTQHIILTIYIIGASLITATTQYRFNFTT